MNGKRLLLGGLALVTLVMVGCGAALAQADDRFVNIVAREWAFDLSRTSVPAGDVTFEAVNQGQADHEVVILKTDLATNALKIKANGAEVDESASGQIMGEVEDIERGQTKTVTLNLAPGRYVLVCNIIGHYGAGMVAVLEVR